MPTLQQKRGTSAALAAVNPTPLAGEIVWVSDTNTLRVGDGTTAYSSLAVISATPTSHSHGNITNAGAIGSTANLPIITTTSGVLTTGSFGTTAATFCQGNDSRLSDTRTPTDGSVTTAKIANDSITYAKLQNVSATDRLLGRSSAGAGDVEEITCSAFGRSLIDDADAAAARTTLSVQPTAFPKFTGAVQTDVSNDLLDSRGNLRVFTTDTAALDKGGSIGLGGKNGTSGQFDPWAFGVIKGAKENGTSGNLAGYLAFGTAESGGIITEKLRINSTGQLLVTAGSVSSGSYKPGIAVSGDDDTGLQQIGGANTISLVTQGSERVRVDAGGNVCVNSTGDTNPAGSNVAGACLSPSGYLSVTRNSDNPLLINRKTNDGTLTTYQQDGTTEGSISVSFNTVSYNAFCGSHWAQLIDGSRPALLRGTVLETIDEMCEWPGEPKNDRLPRVKVSDTRASRRVYGVFMAWDEEYASTGDLYATALGAYMVRVSGVVQSGDLLESAGDGTARTQSDDIVRSSTIGKVSSTHRVAEYDDGSYLVPCVLMCG